MAHILLIGWLKGLKAHTETRGKIFHLSSLLFPIWSVALRRSMERFCTAFPHLYHLSSFKNCFLVWSKSCVLFFRFPLSFIQQGNDGGCLSSFFVVRGNFRVGRWDTRLWSPNPIEGFCCKPFFRLLLDPSQVSESVFDVVCSIKIPKKLRGCLGNCNRIDL